jgi:hypothetical protein
MSLPIGSAELVAIGSAAVSDRRSPCAEACSQLPENASIGRAHSKSREAHHREKHTNAGRLCQRACSTCQVGFQAATARNRSPIVEVAALQNPRRVGA